LITASRRRPRRVSGSTTRRVGACPVAATSPAATGKYRALFNAVLADAGIEVVLSGVHIPRMNPIMERVAANLPPTLEVVVRAVGRPTCGKLWQLFANVFHRWLPEQPW